MSCDHFTDCDYCYYYYHEDNQDDEKCEMFGLPIGDGSPFCRYFLCNKTDCLRDACITYEEIQSVLEGN